MNIKSAGFSLIELMIVVLIIGIGASMAVLYIDTSDDRLKSQAKRILAMSQLARDDAIITGQSLAMSFKNNIDSTEYYFLQLDKAKWVEIKKKPYRRFKLSQDIQVRTILSSPVNNSKAGSNKSKLTEDKDLIYFLPTGETSEFQLLISNDETEYQLSSTLFGELTLKRTEAL
ncbi:pilus assembly FimT family protein [sulfur-oxidizing endosymbiont of Gigantopelta aegis]|uniref:pilus assembly FimT family protein n=1 Tax=sulfur-oxidizing endosymbiont of Gigantopelta aegis TaxID=2794934 RepID=UPI0018DC26A6|nr:GspH/FimT family pseudopilin [sulfur-oxidizing endosymbiont of Gigantopelta aegis]